MLSAPQQQRWPGQPLGGTRTLAHTRRGPCGRLRNALFITAVLILCLLVSQGSAWPLDYRWLYPQCPGPEWSAMCRGCCEYELIRCKCPLQGTPVGYAVPCCRNALNECDPCIIHPGCSIFENCKRCYNGTWGPRDDFFIRGKYCSECRPGWSGGDCLKCGGVLKKRQGHIVLEAYPNNARCEWTLQVDRPFAIEFRFMMLSLEFDHSCRYDYVEVRDGDSINSRVIGRYCGNDRPPPILSSGNTLHILFVSDGYKNFDGFFATFQESSACSSSPCLHDGTCVLDSSLSYHCACLAGYTGKRCEHVLMCGRPMMPLYGDAVSLDVSVGGHVIYRCQPGYQLHGYRIATCMLEGTWSAPPPQCVPVQVRTCPLPPKPTYGDHFLVYGPGDVLIALQYLCYKPYKLSGMQQRTCLANGTWSGTAPSCVKDKEKEKEPKEKETGQGKHPFGKDTKDTDDSTNMVKEKGPEKEEKGLDIDQDIQIVIFKEPGQDEDKNVSVDAGKDPRKDVDKDPDKDVDKDPNVDTVGPKVPTISVPKNTSKESTDDINTVQEKDPELKKDLDKGLDKDVHTHVYVDKGSENVLIIKDLRPKNTSKVKEDNVNTVEEKTSEGDKDLGRGLDKDLHPDKGVLGAPKDPVDDLGRDIEIVLLSEKGKTSVSKDVLIHTEYNLEKDVNMQQRPVAVTTTPPETAAPPPPKTSDNDLDAEPSSNATDVISSNDIENIGKSAPPELDRKQYPVGGNITEISSPGTTEQGGTGSHTKGSEDAEMGPDADSDADSEEHPGTKPSANPTRLPTVTDGLETEKDIKGDWKSGPDNKSVTDRKKCPPPPRLYHGYWELVPGLSPETVEFFCNHSYALSGTARRSCQPDGSWNGTQPICIRACREPKVSNLVRQTVLPPQVLSRKTPVHKLYSSASLGKPFVSAAPTRSPQVLHQLPPGFHPLYTHIQYECLSPYYQHSGSSRRTCLKTGKWSGRHVSCSPVCGKISNFNPQSPREIHWPWLVAIYRRSVPGSGAKMGAVGKAGKGLAGSGTEDVSGSEGWQLVCSGALVNQRSVVAAAHCVTELGKLYPLDAAKVKVVLGKKFRSDQRHTKGLQHLRVASIAVHPSYDPLLLDADVAVLKLLDKARVGEHVLPICLPEATGLAMEEEEATRVKQAVVTGWSLLAEPWGGEGAQGGGQAGAAMEAEEERARVGRVQLGSDAVQCERQYARNGMPISITENMFCGRQQADASPSRICPADTGGILLLPAPTPVPSPGGGDSSILLLEEEEEQNRKLRVWRLLGLVSFGYDHPECNPQLYTVYTRVANFRDFIESNMK
ncbi:inactive serine protease PAMR1 isoform X2 [Alosa pseudoharengus]|uniref:inactive serine protease PAMR1 isoform X2 n=1 Tax=Alosa pseudoharengus TaxID=34774 RepID=UPI003F8C5066